MYGVSGKEFRKDRGKKNFYTKSNTKLRGVGVFRGLG
jgi:hypothetical protein